MTNMSLLKEQGYLRLKDVMSGELLDELKCLATTFSKYGGIHKHHGMRQPHAFRKAPFVAKVFEQPEFVSLIDDLFQGKSWYITNHADLHVNALSGWHKDDGMSYGNGGYFANPSYHVEAPNVYKIAIYFQSHKDFQDGLTIVPKSHRTEKIYKKGDETLYLDTDKGDVLIFDTRLSHTGQLNAIPTPLSGEAETIIDGMKKDIQSIESKFKTKAEKDENLLSLFRDKVGSRISIFFTIAVASETSNTFAINNMNRQLEELGPDVLPFLPKDVTDKLNALGVSSIDSQLFWQKQFESYL